MKQYSLGEITTAELLAAVNKCRLKNKNDWFSLICIVDNVIVRIKNYNTYLQIFTIDGVEQGASMEMKVTDWKQFIDKRLREATK